MTQRHLIYILCLTFSMGLIGCDDGESDPTPQEQTDEGMNPGNEDVGSGTDAGAADMGMAERMMPEGEGELWYLNVGLVEFGVQVPFQLELKRNDAGFEFARIRSTKEGMISEALDWVFDVPVAEDGTFTLTFERFTIPGPYSPTLDNVDVGLIIKVTEATDELICGQITGDVFTLETPVTMSTFSASLWGSEGAAPAAACPGDVETFDPIEECPMIMAGDTEGFTSAELDRRFRVFLPEDYNADTAWPLVIGYHGKNGAEQPWGRIELFIEESGLPEAAQASGHILVLPGSQGIGSEWESGTVGPTRDLAFFDDMVTCMRSSFNIDEDRIHVTGHSAGSYHAAMLTLARSELLASSAVVSTGLLFSYQLPAEQIPLMVMWGGEEDISFMQDFNRQTISLIEDFLGGGHVVVTCTHESLPLPEGNSRHTWQVPTSAWVMDFFEKHPKGTRASPYSADGFPEGWAETCQVQVVD